MTDQNQKPKVTADDFNYDTTARFPLKMIFHGASSNEMFGFCYISPDGDAHNVADRGLDKDVWMSFASLDALSKYLIKAAEKVEFVTPIDSIMAEARKLAEGQVKT